MPTYICRAVAGQLSADTKAQLARGITRAHTEVTGAAGSFAQVIFEDVPQGSYFIAGRQLGAEHLFIHGQIRAGRSAVDREALIRRIVALGAELTRLPANAVWVYVVDVPARCMAEYGHILPEPGGETAWVEQLPPADRARMDSFGA